MTHDHQADARGEQTADQVTRCCAGELQEDQEDVDAVNHW